MLERPRVLKVQCDTARYENNKEQIKMNSNDVTIQICLQSHSDVSLCIKSENRLQYVAT